MPTDSPGATLREPHTEVSVSNARAAEAPRRSLAAPTEEEGTSSDSPRGPWGREEAAGLTKAGVLREVPEELPALLLHVPAPTAAAPRRHHDARGAGVHVVGRHVKPWAGRKRGRGEGSSEAFFSGPQAPGTTEKRLGTPPYPPAPKHTSSQRTMQTQSLAIPAPTGAGGRGRGQGAEQDAKELLPQHGPCFLLGHQAGCVPELGQLGSTLGSGPSAHTH